MSHCCADISIRFHSYTPPFFRHQSNTISTIFFPSITVPKRLILERGYDCSPPGSLPRLPCTLPPLPSREHWKPTLHPLHGYERKEVRCRLPGLSTLLLQHLWLGPGRVRGRCPPPNLQRVQRVLLGRQSRQHHLLRQRRHGLVLCPPIPQRPPPKATSGAWEGRARRTITTRS